jgi:hypothetical protein
MAKYNNALKVLSKDLPQFFLYLMVAILFWLFGVFIFIPTASLIDLSGRTTFLVSLIVMIAFTIMIFKGFSKILNVVEAISILLVEKDRTRWGLNYDQLKTIFKSSVYIVLLIILTALYWPLLSNIHPALYGILLIFAVIIIFVQIIRIVTVGSPAIVLWFTKSSSKKK